MDEYNSKIKEEKLKGLERVNYNWNIIYKIYFLF